MYILSLKKVDDIRLDCCIRWCIYKGMCICFSGDSISTVEYYDPIPARWQIAEPMNTLRSRVGVAVLDGMMNTPYHFVTNLRFIYSGQKNKATNHDQLIILINVKIYLLLKMMIIIEKNYEKVKYPVTIG